MLGPRTYGQNCKKFSVTLVSFPPLKRAFLNPSYFGLSLSPQFENTSCHPPAIDDNGLWDVIKACSQEPCHTHSLPSSLAIYHKWSARCSISDGFSMLQKLNFIELYCRCLRTVYYAFFPRKHLFLKFLHLKELLGKNFSDWGIAKKNTNNNVGQGPNLYVCNLAEAWIRKWKSKMVTDRRSLGVKRGKVESYWRH